MITPDNMDFTTAYIAWSVSFLDDKEFLYWAKQNNELRALADNYIIADLIALSLHREGDLEKVRGIISQILPICSPNFSFEDPNSIKIGMFLLANRLRDYEAGNCLPYDLCKLVNSIEYCFEYPAWLGDLYDVCDWINDDTTRDEVPYLRRESGVLAEEIEKALNRWE